ncbi:hypothetical protein HBB16_13675 [Pseudonocardia sp. MCCB 268]|nr:hypothetical protein [Pseudonocardia cytotoxica]
MREDLLKRVARFSRPDPMRGGFPDSDIPGCGHCAAQRRRLRPAGRVDGDGTPQR